jgi:TrmH family RNA methyltransferase
MLSKNQIKWITSLQLKKYRLEHQLFIAEGVKVIQEFLQSNFELEELFVTNSAVGLFSRHQFTIISEVEMKKISALTTPSNCFAVFRIPQELEIIKNGLIVALDDVRDPGNLGTIIRLCDWFGVKQLLCSTESVDVFNPKVIQSTMGSLTRVQVNYCNLSEFIKNSNLPVYGTFMDGVSIYKEKLEENAIVIFGNESNGISKELENLVTQKIAIPRFGDIQKTESLNVATATGIILSEFRRNS